MQLPKWKKWLSHLFEQHIETVKGTHNDKLRVSFSRGRFQLSTENAIYSYGDLYSNYFKAFEKVQLPKRNIEQVLVLGFGLGSIPLILEQNFNQKYHYTGVEIDETVLQLAERYTLPALTSPLKMFCADAQIFVAACTQTFDLVCVDVFIDDVIPTAFQQSDFLENVKKIIAPDGLLLYNRLAENGSDRTENEAFLKNVFLTVFPKGGYFEVEGNAMFFNEKT